MKLRKTAAGLVILIVIAAIGGAVYWVGHRDSTNNSAGSSAQAAAQAISYKIDSTYTSSATPVGERVSFSKPSQLAPVSTSYQNEITLAQTVNNNSYAAYIAEGFVGSQPSLTPQQLTSVLADTSNSSYLTALSGLKTFVAQRFTSSYQLSYQKAQPFTNASIKTSTWQLNLAAVKSGKIYDGKVVYAASSKGQYYFLVLTPDYNWQSNISTWNQVLDSLKIDQ